MITQLNLETFKEIYHGNLIFGHHFDYSLVNISEYFKNKLREPHIHDFYESCFIGKGRAKVMSTQGNILLRLPASFCCHREECIPMMTFLTARGLLSDFLLIS